MKRIIAIFLLMSSWMFAATANVWHIPTTNESQIATTMRTPLYEIKAADTIVYQGFYKNYGAGGDQNGGTLYYRTVPRGGVASGWSSVALGWHSNVAANQYWKAVIPTTGMSATDVIEYYIKVTFNSGGPETTYLYGSDASSHTTATESAAQAAPFSIRNRPAWILHSNNRTVTGNDIQLAVKSGYVGPDNSLASRWATAGAVYYTTDGSTPAGSLGVASATTSVVAMSYDGVERDASGNGNAAIWRASLAGVLNGLAIGGQVKYKIGLWNSETNEEKFADHLAGTENAVFVYQNGVIGQPTLTINGLNGNYTTSKLYVDEIAGDSIPLNVVFQPGEANVTAAEIYTNVNRRDRADSDANGDGYPDGISGPDGNLLVAGDDSQYYKAYAMTSAGAGSYTLTLPAEKTGAYRLTARWKVLGDSNWRWYSNVAANRRDHAITISPKDARDIRLYEVNVLNVESTDGTFENRSTLEDLHNAPGAPHEANNRWDLDYLKSLGANWLWFQPIHPPARDGREPFGGWGSGNAPYEPGSPYAVKNFFEVSPIFTKNFSGSPYNNADLLSQTNRDASMVAWQDFVVAADTKHVGVMLDAPFNHTAADVELAQAGVDLLQPDGQTWAKTDEIRNRESRFFSMSGNYGNRASNASNIASAPDRFDFGKWNDVKDVFFGRYDSLVEVDSEPERSSYTSEGDWFDAADTDWTANDFVQGGVNRNVTHCVWQYFARYAVYWLEKTRPSGQNRNSSSEPGLTTAQRYEWDARGIDGIRCDFGQGLPPQCWEYIINTARSKKWNFVTMSESLDGGAVTYRANRHFDILNENIVFPLASATTTNDYRTIFETRRTSYGQGLVLINNVSHDEANYNDPWEAFIRFSVAGTMDGAPMIFSGQELGISTNYGYTYYELNFGKNIPHFKRFNSMQPIWDDVDFGKDQLFPVYAGVGAARSFSPALRSSNRWFLDGDGYNSKIHAVAKYETANASPALSDVVIAFSNLDRNNDKQDNFKIPSGLAPLLGIKDGRSYNVKNIAAYLGADATRRSKWLWNGSAGYTGSQLKNNGFYVMMPKVPTMNSSANANDPAWNQRPFEAQYLKVYDVTAPPAPVAPAPALALFGTVVGNQVTFTWSAASDPDGGVSGYDLQIGTAPDGHDVFDGQTTTTSQMVTVAYGTTLYARVRQINYAGIAGSYSTASAAVLALDPVADADGDGQSNAAEQSAGTDPQSSLSVLKVMVTTVTGNDVQITVSTVTGKSYQLETSATLEGGSWVSVGAAVVATGDSTNFTHVNGAGELKRFYRVRVLP